jgi:hypothetical protein
MYMMISHPGVLHGYCKTTSILGLDSIDLHLSYHKYLNIMLV